MNNSSKKTVAVFFGGRSPEHDVSVITGIQAIKALDPIRYEAFPVYISPRGEWLLGQDLLNLSNYMLTDAVSSRLTKVGLDLSNAASKSGGKPGRLICQHGWRSYFLKQDLRFDLALLALHGIHGENGEVAALLDLANVPYTGMRHLGGAISMNKIITKRIARSLEIAVLPDRLIKRPQDNFIVSSDDLKRVIEGLDFPLCVKPCNLGSSIGVARVNNLLELAAVLPSIFKYDQAAIVEPFIDNLVEYNLAVGYIGAKLATSALEIPKCSGAWLDFKQKYLAASKDQPNKFGTKSTDINLGMLAMTRELNPSIAIELDRKLRNWAELIFTTIDGKGFPRIDFLSDRMTGQVWLNEINPCPGSFGFYLWEASSHKLLFTELLNLLLDEAIQLQQESQLPSDPTPTEARLFPRSN